MCYRPRLVYGRIVPTTGIFIQQKAEDVTANLYLFCSLTTLTLGRVGISSVYRENCGVYIWFRCLIILEALHQVMRVAPKVSIVTMFGCASEHRNDLNLCWWTNFGIITHGNNNWYTVDPSTRFSSHHHWLHYKCGFRSKNAHQSSSFLRIVALEVRVVIRESSRPFQISGRCNEFLVVAGSYIVRGN